MKRECNQSSCSKREANECSLRSRSSSNSSRGGSSNCVEAAFLIEVKIKEEYLQ